MNLSRLTAFTLLTMFLLPFPVLAQSQALSVTPPLFQLSIEPGDIWQSSVRVVNSNEYPLTVYSEVVNFAPHGEDGQGRFVPLLEGEDDVKGTLASWIQIPAGPHIIPRGQTREISFFVEVPEDAAPGGHFAAILVSTEPPPTAGTSLALVTTQTVASLLFTRIGGDIVEKGDIREFSVLDRPLELPEAEFSLRFENKGNVHLLPRGDIVITNMWGKERGIIPINQNSHFGNVLPESIRDFHFSWKGEHSLTDIGRYKAIATLAYGEDGIKSVSQTTFFWVIPVKGALITFGALIFIILGISWMIRRYVRSMLMHAGVDPDHVEQHASIRTKELKLTSYSSMSAPIREGALDLRSRLHHVSESKDVLRTLLGFIVQYYRFFVALILLILGFVGIVYYVEEVGSRDSEYEVIIEEGGVPKTLTNEEIQATLPNTP